jgi:hypothetical protein
LSVRHQHAAQINQHRFNWLSQLQLLSLPTATHCIPTAAQKHPCKILLPPSPAALQVIGKFRNTHNTCAMYSPCKPITSLCCSIVHATFPLSCLSNELPTLSLVSHSQQQLLVRDVVLDDACCQESAKLCCSALFHTRPYHLQDPKFAAGSWLLTRVPPTGCCSAAPPRALSVAASPAGEGSDQTSQHAATCTQHTVHSTPTTAQQSLSSMEKTLEINTGDVPHSGAWICNIAHTHGAATILPYFDAAAIRLVLLSMSKLSLLPLLPHTFRHNMLLVDVRRTSPAVSCRCMGRTEWQGQSCAAAAPRH